MALYEYDCVQCQTIFDIMRPMSKMDEVVRCPSCGSSNIHKHWSPFSVARIVTPRYEPNSGSGEGASFRGDTFTGSYIHNCYIHHCGRGIVANGVDLRLKDMHFSHNATDIEARNANIHIEGDFQSD
jgi:putative FmdB family regulatory protein